MKIVIPNSEGIDPRLLRPFKDIQYARRPGDRFRVEQRASSFPVCPRKYHIYRRLPIQKRPYEDETFIRDSSALEGTALHLALQKWFGIKMKDHAYGNWGCVKCGKLRKHKRGIQLCKKCGDEMIYVEYAVKRLRDTPFTGHIDMILWYRDIRFLVDFKGSSTNKIEEYKRGGVKYEHYLQANAYANAINLGQQDVGGLPGIDKIVILYVDRGRPWHTWWPIQLPLSKRVYRETLALLKRGEDSLKTMQVPRGICDSSRDNTAKWCEAKDYCFDPLLETKLSDKVQPIDDRKQDRKLEHQVEKRLAKGVADGDD